MDRADAHGEDRNDAPRPPARCRRGSGRAPSLHRAQARPSDASPIAADHPQGSTTSASRTSNAHDWSTHGDVSRVKVNVSNRGTAAGGEDLAAQPQVPGRSRIVEQPITAANQRHAQHDHEDHVDRSRYQTAASEFKLACHLGLDNGRLFERTLPVANLGHARRRWPVSYLIVGSLGLFVPRAGNRAQARGIAIFATIGRVEIARGLRYTQTVSPPGSNGGLPGRDGSHCVAADPPLFPHPAWNRRALL